MRRFTNRHRQRGQATAGYVAIVALGLIAVWFAWAGLGTAIAMYYERFAFALGLPIT